MVGLLFKKFFFFRLFAGMLTALTLSLYLLPRYIKYLAKWHAIQPIREYVPDRHLKKKGTPTAGGMMLIISYILSAMVWVSWNSLTVWIFLFVILFFGGIGLLDDFFKMKNTQHQGLTARYKYGLQSIGALFVATILYQLHLADTYTIGPIIFPKWFLIPWAYWVIVGSSNAFNLTDGLDGLAISQVLIITFALFLLSLQKDAFHSLNIKEISILISILIGSSLGFLWYNIYPARVFMGDTGALALGALLGTLSLILHQEIFFAIISFIPIIETISVILQVFYFKATGKRFFRMAPFHHHLELLGVSEVNIVLYFSLMTTFISALCLARVNT